MSIQTKLETAGRLGGGEGMNVEQHTSRLAKHTRWLTDWAELWACEHKPGGIQAVLDWFTTAPLALHVNTMSWSLNHSNCWCFFCILELFYQQVGKLFFVIQLNQVYRSPSSIPQLTSGFRALSSALHLHLSHHYLISSSCILASNMFSPPHTCWASAQCWWLVTWVCDTGC